MIEKKRIAIPASVTLADQIVKVKRQLSEWVGKVGEYFDFSSHLLRLAKCERNENGYVHVYELIEKVDR